MWSRETSQTGSPSVCGSEGVWAEKFVLRRGWSAKVTVVARRKGLLWRGSVLGVGMCCKSRGLWEMRVCVCVGAGVWCIWELVAWMVWFTS